MEKDIARELLEAVPKAMHAIRKRMRESARASRMTIPQLRILANLNREPQTLSDLAEVIGVSRPAMSKQIEMMVGKGLVIRTVRADDRRHQALSLSTRGRAVFLDRRKVVQGQVAALVAGLTADEQARLQAGLEILERVFS